MINSKIVAIIPARYASIRLPGKPLIDLCGKPMIQHVYERTKQSKHIERVIVATDHTEIADAVHKFGGEVVLTPSEARSGSDRIAMVASTLDETEIIVNVQGDEPLIVPQMIDNAIQPLLDDKTIQVGTVIKKIKNKEELLDPNIPKVVIDNLNFAIYFSRYPIPFFRDDKKENNWLEKNTYYKHIGLYVFRKDFLLKFSTWEESALEKAEKLEQLRIIEHGYRIKTVISDYDSISVDTPENVELVRNILKQGKTTL